MNKRIRELIQLQNGNRGLLWTEEDKEEFAELIVRECIDIVGKVPNGYRDYRNQIEDSIRTDCLQAIQEHFGVDE